jgi:hypothetical protein
LSWAIGEEISEPECCDFGIGFLGGVDHSVDFWVVRIEAVDFCESDPGFVYVSVLEEPSRRFRDSEEHDGGKELYCKVSATERIKETEFRAHSEDDLESDGESPREGRLNEATVRERSDLQHTCEY